MNPISWLQSAGADVEVDTTFLNHFKANKIVTFRELSVALYLPWLWYIYDSIKDAQMSLSLIRKDPSRSKQH